jgi:hypothetical protein
MLLTSPSIHLSELSPQAFRVFVVGTCYQLGSLAASASSTIESTLGERFPLPPTKSGITRYKYGTVICIFMACVSALFSPPTYPPFPVLAWARVVLVELYEFF